LVLSVSFVVLLSSLFPFGSLLQNLVVFFLSLLDEFLSLFLVSGLLLFV
jgi:hypothetical protein